jgi:HAE1 family hydrophobic/amphiphilic exporter-1
MLFGTIFGVIIVPGLYFVFGSVAEGKSLIQEEEEESLAEEVSHHV